MPIKITILVDDLPAPGDDTLIHEHGLAMAIRTPQETILFDTGYSDAAFRNAQRLGIDPAQIDKVVISHGHLDHAGGVKHLISRNPSFTLIAHPGILAQKIIRSGSTVRSFGISEDLPVLKKSGIRFNLQKRSIMISEDIMTTGFIPMKTDFEAVENRFFTEENGREVPDFFEDEKSLIIRTPLGTVVLLGCSHRGIINTLHHVAQVTGNNKIYGIIGGLHLGNANPLKIDQICAHLAAFDLKKIIVGHCTGTLAVNELIKQFGDTVDIITVGKMIEI